MTSLFLHIFAFFATFVHGPILPNPMRDNKIKMLFGVFSCQCLGIKATLPPYLWINWKGGVFLPELNYPKQGKKTHKISIPLWSPYFQFVSKQERGGIYSGGSSTLLEPPAILMKICMVTFITTRCHVKTVFKTLP